MARFRIAYNLVLGLPDSEGYVPMLLIRQEQTVNYCEVFHARTQGTIDSNRILAWEAWSGEGLQSRGDRLRWKHS